MSQRRTSLSFPLGIVSAFLIVDCAAETRNWDAGDASGGAGGGTTTSTATAGSPSGTAGASAVIGGNAPVTQTTATLGGSSAELVAGAGGATSGSGGAQAGTAGMAGLAGAAGNQPQTCDDPSDCDDGNTCNGVETCTGGVCVPGSLPAACAGMDAAHCRCSPVGSGNCSIVGLDADGDGIKTRACLTDPGLDCNDADATVTHNACNGCATLPGAPGGSCGSCGSSKWVCSGTENAICSTPLPAPKQCSGVNVQSCSAGEWVTDTACSGTTPYCVVTAGVPQCGVCNTPGATRCKPGVTNVVQACSADRLSWTDATCTGSNQCYLYATDDYRCLLCQPGNTRCKSGVTNVVQTCNATGTAWVDTTCGASSLCVFSSSASMYTCAQLLPSDLQNEVEFERSVPAERFDYRSQDAVGVQPFLDFASGFALV